MTDAAIRQILKSSAPEMQPQRWELIEKYPDRSRLINAKLFLAEQRLQAYKNSPHFKKKIRGFANNYGWSDVHPYEVVKVISDQTVEVREMDTKQTVFPQNFQVGGFVAHCVDNYNQDYEYTSNPDNPVIRIRWSKANSCWNGSTGKFIMEDKPYKKYDYNF